MIKSLDLIFAISIELIVRTSLTIIVLLSILHTKENRNWKYIPKTRRGKGRKEKKTRKSQR